MLGIFNITQGIVQTIMQTAGLGSATQTVLPQEMITAIESCGFFESIPLWAVTLIRRTFCYSNIFHYDIVSLWQVFQNISLYCNSSNTNVYICRRAKSKRWKEFHKRLLCRFFRRCNYNFSLYNLFSICKFPSSSKYRSCSSYNGMELYRRTNI